MRVKKVREVEVLSHTIVRVMDLLEDADIQYKICGDIRRHVKKVSEVVMAVKAPLTHTFMTLMKGLDKDLDLVTKKDLHDAKRVNFWVGDLPFVIHTAKEDHWGAMILDLTGNWAFVLKMRNRAKARGMSLNPYGLWLNGEIIAGKTEEQIFYSLEVPYLEPQARSILKCQDLPTGG